MYALLGHSGPPECLQRPRDVSIPESELSELASWVRANASRVTVDTYELYEARAGRYRATLYIDWEDFNSGPEFQDIPVLCSCEVYVYRGMRLVYSAYLDRSIRQQDLDLPTYLTLYSEVSSRMPVCTLMKVNLAEILEDLRRGVGVSGEAVPHV